MSSWSAASSEALDLDRQQQLRVCKVEAPLANRVESVLANPSDQVALAQLQLEEILGCAAGGARFGHTISWNTSHPAPTKAPANTPRSAPSAAVSAVTHTIASIALIICADHRLERDIVVKVWVAWLRACLRGRCRLGSAFAALAAK